RDRQHRKVFALHEADGERGPASRLPRHAGLGIRALREIDQLGQLVALVRIDEGPFRRFEHSGVVAEIGRAPVRARRRCHLTAVPLGDVPGGRWLRTRLLGAGDLHAAGEQGGAHGRGQACRDWPSVEYANHAGLTRSSRATLVSAGTLKRSPVITISASSPRRRRVACSRNTARVRASTCSSLETLVSSVSSALSRRSLLAVIVVPPLPDFTTGR